MASNSLHTTSPGDRTPSPHTVSLGSTSYHDKQSRRSVSQAPSLASRRSHRELSGYAEEFDYDLDEPDDDNASADDTDVETFIRARSSAPQQNIFEETVVTEEAAQQRANEAHPQEIVDRQPQFSSNSNSQYDNNNNYIGINPTTVTGDGPRYSVGSKVPSNGVTAEDIKKFPFVAQDGRRFKLTHWSDANNLPPSNSIVEHKMYFETSQEEDRDQVRFEPDTIRHIGEGLGSGRKWLGFLDPARPNTLVTRCKIRPDGVVKKSGLQALQEWPQPDVVIPSLKSLQDIATEFPNHVWGKIIRIFHAEGINGVQAYNMLPDAYKDKLQEPYLTAHPTKEKLGRPANKLEHAFGREIEQAMSEDRKYRAVYQTRGKGKSRRTTVPSVVPVAVKRKAKDGDDTPNEDNKASIEPDNGTVGNGIKRQRRVRLDPNRIIPRLSPSVTSLDRQESITHVYASDVDELRTQKRVENHIQNTLELLADRIAFRDYADEATLPERLRRAETEFNQEFNYFMQQEYPDGVGLSQASLPKAGESDDMFVVLLSVLDRASASNPATVHVAARDLRVKAFNILDRFLQGLQASIKQQIAASLRTGTPLPKGLINDYTDSIVPAAGGVSAPGAGPPRLPNFGNSGRSGFMPPPRGFAASKSRLSLPLASWNTLPENAT